MHERTFLLLTALADEPRHGYAVLREVSDLSGGRVRLRPGTLHAALDRLVDDGLVGVEREEVEAGPSSGATTTTRPPVPATSSS